MRTLAKYVLLMSAAVGVAWACVSVEIAGRTPYGHFRAAGGGTWMEAVRGGWLSARAAMTERWGAWTASSEPEAAPEPEPKPDDKGPRRAAEPPAVQEDKGAERRVAILQAAQQEAAPKQERPAKARTRVDAPMTEQDRAALDRVVSGR